MTEAERWLRDRLGDAPAALVERMIEALPLAAPTVSEAPASGALDLYARVARGSGGREDALPLLAADALFTHAFEAQAALDPAGVEELVARCGRALGEVLL